MVNIIRIIERSTSYLRQGMILVCTVKDAPRYNRFITSIDKGYLVKKQLSIPAPSLSYLQNENQVLI